MDKPVNVLVWYWGRDASRYVLEMLHALRALPNLNIILSCSNGSALHVAASEIAGLTIVPVMTYAGGKQTWRGKLSALGGVFDSPITMWRFHRMLRKHQIDVALCAQSAIWDVMTIPMLAGGPVRYIQIAHEVSAHPDEAYPLRDRLTRLQLDIADGIVVLSEQIRGRVVARCPGHRCWKIPHPAYNYGPRTAAIHPRGTRPIRLLFFGRITPYKGLDRLFAALQLLRERALSFKLILAGSGDLDGYRQELKSPDVEVHNYWLSDEQVAKLLASSDAVVLPYNVSSQSGVAAASFGSGRPVVATPVGGLMEQVIPGTGMIATDMSAEAFADALTALIGDSALFDRCAAGALRHAQMDLDWQGFAQALGDVIQQVCLMPRRGRETPHLTTVGA